MDYSGGLLKRGGESVPAAESCKQHQDMQSVQNLEAVINEGLRAALMEETPDDSLEMLLKHLGNALNGERPYIFETTEYGGTGKGEPAKRPPGGVRQLVPEVPRQQTHCH